MTGEGSPAPSGLASRRSEEHTSELQSLTNLVCRLLLAKKQEREIHPRPSLRPAYLRYALIGRLLRGHPLAGKVVVFFFLKGRGPPEFPLFPLPAVLQS